MVLDDVPRGADAVVMVEQTEFRPDSLAIDLVRPARPGQFIGYAGADMASGETVLRKGMPITAREIGMLAACGLAGGAAFNGTVFPFILRGVSLLGIDSVMAPRALREKAWSRLVGDLDTAKLESLSTTIGFDAIVETATALLEGKVRGRVVIDMAG